MTTFKDFRRLMERRHRSVDDLVGLFRGKIDDPRGFFTNVMSRKYDHVILPYRSVLEYYAKEAELGESHGPGKKASLDP